MPSQTASPTTGIGTLRPPGGSCPDFANAVTAAGLRFVGPPASVLAALGDKAEAKAIAERAGVPVLPGYSGTGQDDAGFAKAAREASVTTASFFSAGLRLA